MTDITKLAQREKFEAWFKSSFHPDKTGPYIKDQLYFAWKAAGAELVQALEKAQAGEKQWREVVDAFCADDADWHKLTNSNNELIALLSQALCKQADRIAELESRTVTVENLQESAYRAGLTAGWNLGLANNNDGFNKCLAAHTAGIKVEAE